MDAIKNDIKPWSPGRREIGLEVLALIEPELRKVLTEAYSSIGTRLDDIPDAVYQPELAKFKQIATGDFSDAYFKSQTEIARNIAKTSSVAGYFATGYSIYAGGLLTALLRKTRWKRNKQEAYVRSLLSSIFHDVAVATSVVMTDLAAATLKERAELERVQAQEAEASRQTMAVLNEALRELSSGNLSYRITAALPEKSESMRRDFNTASATLSNVIGKISTAVQDICHGMNEISSSTNDLSRRTERQAASIEETAAALEQITATVQHASDAALQAKHAASTAATDATQSGAVMKQAESAMSDIAGSSQQIGQIVSVIDEIAFQTNLLALNAGVEAARAGESGKGFAVVASEVRSLAQRASEAARDIRTLIGTSSQQVKHGVSLVEDTSETLNGIVGRVSEIDTLITGIAASSREQAGGLKEINSAVAEMDQFTQQNAAMVEQSTAVAAGVQDLALELSSLIAHFKVANQTRAALPALDMKRAAA